MSTNSWFEIDKKGLAKLLARKGGKVWILHELLQNCWDEEGCTKVEVSLIPVDGRSEVNLIVKDNVPNGFANITHIYTMFAESLKKSNPTQRGRFNFGEKLVLAACSEAKVITTTAAFSFTSAEGRKVCKERTVVGSEFRGLIKMTREELRQVLDDVQLLIPPANTTTIINNNIVLLKRKLEACFEVILPTEFANEDGEIRRTERKTIVNVYAPHLNEIPHIYEMGIPIVDLECDKFHVDIQQKVPLSLDRDSVTPAYLKRLRAAVLNNTFSNLEQNDFQATWVSEATTDKSITAASINSMLDARFGKKRVSFDPSDQEANNRAVAAGYTIIPGRSLASETWEQIRNNGLVLPAGKVTPGHFQEFSPDGDPMIVIPPDKWTVGMTEVVTFYKNMAKVVIGKDITVTVANDLKLGCGACFGNSVLILNKVRLGSLFFEQGISNDVLELGIHEFSHDQFSNHLSDDFHKECCRLGVLLLRAVNSGKLSLL